MAIVSLRQAEELTGKTRSALLKAIKNRRISATRSDRNEWMVDVAELSRVFDVRLDEPEKKGLEVSGQSDTEVIQLRERVLGLENLVLSLNDTVGDLRTRLTKESEERSRITLMLTHQMGQKPESTGPERSQTSNKWLIALILVLVLFLLAGVAWIIHFNHLVN